ncbi:DUF1971 domain-containing protein [Pseudopontixanthobacter vadosimaris]|uniref:DUF1971 domain-containing protein n=1 Tax=Pseudopontixanthobacter vadosimaris TaxID=2726450 RepID=UPI001475858D|nr:DUF1971 domain-containing protein [Pseudopontixanthobacter vadosimaris]
MPQPYRSTPIFDADTLPDALQKEHRTKAGVWGVLRVLDGEVRLRFGDGQPASVVKPGQPGLLLPEQPHWVELAGAMRMQVDFYDEYPDVQPEDDA